MPGDVKIVGATRTRADLPAKGKALHDFRLMLETSNPNEYIDERTPISSSVCVCFEFVDATFQNLIQLQPYESNDLNVDMIRKWLWMCDKHHEDCIKSFEETPRGLLVIDTTKLCVTRCPSGANYAGLSYTWGNMRDRGLCLLQENDLDLRTPGSLLTLPNASRLPGIFGDAINVSKQLGLRYIWIDRLCIVQDDKVQKHSQISAMHQIYRAAQLTIVVTMDPAVFEGIPGMAGNPRATPRTSARRSSATQFEQLILRSKWSTRAWTYQEGLLAKRRLFLTPQYTYFACQQQTIGERSSGIDYSSITNDTQNIGWGPLTISAHLEEYLKRQMSFDTDILNAFAGVSMAFSEQMGTAFVYGLAEKDLAHMLLWTCSESYELRRSCPWIPGWTWAAYRFPTNLKFSFHRPDGLTNSGIFSEYFVQDPGVGLRKLNVPVDPRFPVWVPGRADFIPVELKAAAARFPGSLLFKAPIVRLSRNFEKIPDVEIPSVGSCSSEAHVQSDAVRELILVFMRPGRNTAYGLVVEVSDDCVRRRVGVGTLRDAQEQLVRLIVGFVVLV